MKISTILFDTAKFAGAAACSLIFFAAYAYFFSAPIGTPMPGDPVNPDEVEIQNFMNVSKSMCGRLGGPSGAALDEFCNPVPGKDVRQYAEEQVQINKRAKADFTRLMGSDEEIAARSERAEKCRDDPDVYRGQFAHDCRMAYVGEQESSLSDDDAKRLSDQCSENPARLRVILPDIAKQFM